MTLFDPDQDLPLDWRFKGIAPEFSAQGTDNVPDAGAHLFDDSIHFPIAILQAEAIEANSRWMQQFTKETGVKIAPHGKTTMAPALLDRQLADGAWGITAATIGHLRAYYKFGIRRIILANQLVGDGAIRWVVEAQNADPQFELYVLVDSVEGVELLCTSAKRWKASRPIKVLIEVGHPNGRGGVRILGEGHKIGQHVFGASPYLELCGVETYEGVFQTSPQGATWATSMVQDAVCLADNLERDNLIGSRFILTAGGSAFYDIVVDQFHSKTFRRTPDFVLRSGCYLTHDDGLYNDLYKAFLARSGKPSSLDWDLQPALSIWSHVLSHPEPYRWICGLGKRDIGHDIGMPKLIGWAKIGDKSPRQSIANLEVTAINDHHIFLDGPANPALQVGDIVGFGVSHPCTTIDKWRALMIVDKNWYVTGAIRTYF